MSLAYYNEIDPVAAQWLRNLIAAGHIAPGWVDERSIEDVKPWEIEPFTQCHFFAGVGVWSLALRRAGWPDHWPIWTGSCPCQPFSASGKKSGFDDERHLWPAFHWLIQQRGPGIVVGEQVASKAAEPWIDLVQADLEAMGYAFGCIPFPSASIGAPHIRDRAYWAGHSNQPGSQGFAGNGGPAGRQGQSRPVAETGVSGGVADAECVRHGELERDTGAVGSEAGSSESEKPETGGLAQETWDRGGTGGGADTSCERRQQNTRSASSDEAADGRTGRDGGKPHSNNEPSSNEQVHGNGEPGPVNSFWANADWLFCRDGKWRPVEPGTFPLAHGTTARVGRLRAYGNAINAEQATIFIEVIKELVE